MDKGIIWDISKGYPSHVLSWHELNIPKLGNVRIWFHSRGEIGTSDFTYGKDNRARVAFTFKSIDIQVHGDKFSPVSEEEKQLRLALAQFAPAKSKNAIKSSNFRFIPIGQLEVDHMQCIKACYDANKFSSPSGVRIVKSDITPTLLFKNGQIQKNSTKKSASGKSLKIRSTQPNAIAIAKLYSDLSSIGTQKVIKQISISTGLPSQNIYTALRVARDQGWLTSNGVGKTGGVLSVEGLEAFKRLEGESVLEELFNGNGATK